MTPSAICITERSCEAVLDTDNTTASWGRFAYIFRTAPSFIGQHLEIQVPSASQASRLWWMWSWNIYMRCPFCFSDGWCPVYQIERDRSTHACQIPSALVFLQIMKQYIELYRIWETHQHVHDWHSLFRETNCENGEPRRMKTLNYCSPGLSWNVTPCTSLAFPQICDIEHIQVALMFYRV